MGDSVKSSTKTMISLHYSNHISHIQEIVESVFDQNLNWDVVLQVSSGPTLREFKCHRAILSFASDFFNKILLQTQYMKDPVIILPDFDPNVVKSVLTYIYTGEINLAVSMMNDFIEVCTLFEIKGIIVQQSKFLDNVDQSHEERRDQRKDEEEIFEYTGIPTQIITEDADEEHDVTMSDDDRDSIMEEEYVLEDDSTEIIEQTDAPMSNTEENKPLLVSPSLDIPNPIIIPRVISKPSSTSTEKTAEPMKKVRLKHEQTPKKHKLLLEKLKFGFNEIEGSVGSWKHARLLADGTANINAANAQYFKERLEVCTAKIYENVVVEDPNTEKYKVRMYFCADPVRLKALVECLICEKSIQVSYKHKNGKFKQWINSNVLRHVETLHKSNFRPTYDTKKTRQNLF